MESFVTLRNALEGARNVPESDGMSRKVVELDKKCRNVVKLSAKLQFKREYLGN